MKTKQKITKPILRFTPTAWAKLIFMRDLTDNEVGGFGITEANDLLLVTDIALVKQKVTSVSVSFDDESVANFFEDQVDAGRKPEQFARLWIHTHPGTSPEPSMQDEETFQRVFGSCDWTVIFIIASHGKTFARLRFNTGPGGQVNIPVCVEYGFPFESSDFELWKKEYEALVAEEQMFSVRKSAEKTEDQESMEVFGGCGDDFETATFTGDNLIEEIEKMHPAERQVLFDELAVRSDFWDEESGVFYE